MKINDDEDALLRAAALENAKSILKARQRAAEELFQAKEALELKTGQLAHSLSMVRATLEAATDGILAIGEGGRVTAYNSTFMDMWGVPLEIMNEREHRALIEHMGRQFTDDRTFRAAVDRIDRESPRETFDVLELADGRIIERVSKIQFVEDRRVGRVWSFRDVTERRRAERALRDETRLLELLNRTGILLAAQLDLDPLLQQVTDAGTQLSGAEFGAFFYNVSESGGNSYRLYVLSGAPREAFAHLEMPRATELFGPTFRGEGPVRCDDVTLDRRYGMSSPHFGMPKGHLPVRSYLAVPVHSRGEVIGGLFFAHSKPGMFSERSERLAMAVAAQAGVAIDNARLYEQAQRAAEERELLLDNERAARAEAERSSELKHEFLATLSHELRTPLSAILGWSMILRQSGIAEADLRQGLETIERNARVQTQLIEDLLDMSRITSGKLRLDIQQIDPVLFVEAAIDTVRPAAEARGQVLIKLLDPATGPVLGDPNRLQQVVWNLLSNAIKFTPRGGRVQVVLRRLNSHVVVEVADTGIGIKPEFVPHVFDRFRQADASTTRNYGGLGLGLSIVKHLTELHGGTVSVTSEGEGKGSTFAVALPLSAVHSRALPDRRQSRGPLAVPLEFKPADLSGIKVLVVDDEPDARALIRRVLTDCHADVEIAGNAAEALSAIEAGHPDVLISDIGMPQVDGYELLRRVRRLGADRGGQVPAIALTAFARTEDRTRAMRAGFLAHVAKPVEPAELVASIASIVGRAGESEGA